MKDEGGRRNVKLYPGVINQSRRHFQAGETTAGQEIYLVIPAHVLWNDGSIQRA
jgi:hypothetical protein